MFKLFILIILWLVLRRIFKRISDYTSEKISDYELRHELYDDHTKTLDEFNSCEESKHPDSDETLFILDHFVDKVDKS